MVWLTRGIVVIGACLACQFIAEDIAGYTNLLLRAGANAVGLGRALVVNEALETM